MALYQSIDSGDNKKYTRSKLLLFILTNNLTALLQLRITRRMLSLPQYANSKTQMPKPSGSFAKTGSDMFIATWNNVPLDKSNQRRLISLHILAVWSVFAICLWKTHLSILRTCSEDSSDCSDVPADLSLMGINTYRYTFSNCFFVVLFELKQLMGTHGNYLSKVIPVSIYKVCFVAKINDAQHTKRTLMNFADTVSLVCVEVLRPSQPNGVMSSAVSLPNHTFTGQA